MLSDLSEKEIGELIASAMERVGQEGVITVQVRGGDGHDVSVPCDAISHDRGVHSVARVSHPSFVAQDVSNSTALGTEVELT